MKKFLLALICIFSVSAVSAQSLAFEYIVYATPTGGSVGPQPFWVKITFANNSTAVYNFVSNGYYYDSIPHPGQGKVEFITYDCQGNLIMDTKYTTPSTQMIGDTAIVPCQLQQNCMAMILKKGSSSGLTLNLQDSSSSATTITPPLVRISDWSFGDGNWTNQTNNLSVSHTYAQAGTYNVCLISTVYDTVNNILICEDTVCAQYTVGGTSPNFCSAAYTVDTSSSGAGNLVIWNTSSPAYNDPNYQNSYSWDFGDGGTSTQAFPSHSYANPGIYQVCVTITSADTAGVCTSTYCDSIGLDANGNLLFKTAGGFSLNVLDPATVGIHENQLKDISIYPNPANDVVQVNLGSAELNADWRLSDLKGAVVRSGRASGQQFELNISELNSGIYILTLESSAEVANYKLIVE